MALPTAAALAQTFFKTSLGLPTVLKTALPAAGPAAPGAAPPPPPPPDTPTLYRADHTRYRVTNTRIAYIDQVNPGNANFRTIAGTRDLANGDTIYLPFFSDHITSIRLPFPAPPGVSFFFTDNLSGCKIFVDEVTGTNDIVVYHANTKSHTAGPLQWADFQNPAAGTILDNYHTAARGDYAGVALNNVASAAMPRYFRSAGVEERRKDDQGRRATSPDRAPQTFQGNQVSRQRPLFAGGCFVCGFPGAARWEIYVQAWGSVKYERPSYAKGLFTFDWVAVHKRRTQGANVGTAIADMHVFESYQLY